MIDLEEEEEEQQKQLDDVDKSLPPEHLEVIPIKVLDDPTCKIYENQYSFFETAFPDEETQFPKESDSAEVVLNPYPCIVKQEKVKPVEKIEKQVKIVPKFENLFETPEISLRLVFEFFLICFFHNAKVYKVLNFLPMRSIYHFLQVSRCVFGEIISMSKFWKKTWQRFPGQTQIVPPTLRIPGFFQYNYNFTTLFIQQEMILQMMK